jgi:peptidoglycan/LPS O-acetylase OafA/YrhL
VTEFALAFVQVWRAVTLVLLLACLWLVPLAVGQLARPKRTWLLLVGFDLLLVGYASLVLARFDEEKVRWYATPLAFVASVFLLAYSFRAIREEHQS